MTIVAPFGFYGWGNIGDESTLQGFACLVARHGHGLKVWVASRDPSHTARVEPAFRYFNAVNGGLRRRWARMRARAQVVAGGTPIMDGLGAWPLSELVPMVREAAHTKQPFAFVGVGVESLTNEASRRLVAAELAPCVRHWSVRSERDRARLQTYGVPGERITVAADMAWLLRSVDRQFGRQLLRQLKLNRESSYIGVNINNERTMVEQEPELPVKLAQVLDRLVEKSDAQVLFLCNEVRLGETFDSAAAQNILARMRHQDRAVLVPNEYWTPQQMLSTIGCCRFTISTRYHFCLFSALEDVPFLALKRSDKVDDLCWDLGWSHAAGLGGLTVDSLYDLADDLRKCRDSLVTELRSRVDAMRARAYHNTVALTAIGGDQ